MLLEATVDLTIDPDLIEASLWVSGINAVTTPWEMPLHRHRKGQLLFSARGVVTCETEKDTWIIPAHSAVWIPPGALHRASGSGLVETYCLFIEPACAGDMPQTCCALTVSPLLQELLKRAARLPENVRSGSPQERITRVILDEVAAAPVEDFRLPMPNDTRLRRIAEGLIADPSDKTTATEWATRVGVGERTLSRMLQTETGMSFGQWRRRLHVFVGLRQLGAGNNIQTVAANLGYESASGFTTMFRKTVGKPPARYLADRRSAIHDPDA